ncbi:MAG: DNA polymerase I [Sphaerobacteraceae bacterium]|nr:MAG: DNA polymerase I [Sphaerobacteraceae bacterium]
MPDASKTTGKTLMLVDGHGLAYRAYHAMPESMATASGEPTNAVFGFTSMLLDAIRDHAPDYIIVSFDVGKTFRHEAFEEYKAHRAPMPDDLRTQIDRMYTVLEAMNIPVYTKDGFEADDVIGTIARMAGESCDEVLIVTGDSDLLQLADGKAKILLPGRPRFSDFRLFDRDRVIERYGFVPERIPEFKALVGDTSDNIPGVPGVGEKTARNLMETYPDLETLRDNLDDVKPPRAQNSLKENFEIAIQGRELATIVRDVELDLDLDRCVVTDFDRDEVVRVFRELEFRTLLERLPDVVKAQPEAPKEESVRTIVTSKQELDEFIESAKTADALAVDVETDSTKASSARLVGIAVATGPTTSFYIPVGHSSNGRKQLDESAVHKILAPILEHDDTKLYAHNAKYDAVVLERHGYSLPRFTFDTMIAAYILGENSLGLKELAFTRLGIEMQEITSLIGKGKSQITMDLTDMAEAGDYACADVESTWQLKSLLDPELEQQKQSDLFYDIEMPLIDVLIEMEKTGIALDVELLQTVSKQLTGEIGELEKEIYGHAGQTFNINSPRQMANVLFEELKLPAGRKTKTGYSVNQEVLENLRDAHDIVPLILEYRQLQKLKSTYVDALPNQVNPETGRVHTSFNQTVAATGRLSSTDPNLQNIPVRSGIGRTVRRAFIPDNNPDTCPFDEPATFLAADYSQVELRLMAHFSEDQTLLKAFQAGQDIHAATAADVFGVKLEDVSSDMRRIAKTVNFGIMYGMQAYGLSRDTGMPRAEAQQFIDTYFERFPGVRSYLDNTIELAKDQGYISTLFGRRRYVGDINASNFNRRTGAERIAINMPLQGTAADIMKIAMIRMQRELREKKFKARMILQVHDELLFEVPESEVKKLAAAVKDVMENVTELQVPLVTEVSVGANWEELEPI